ncbi:MAG: FG-GAP-like repeat-containing protein, partial [Acidobacteriota bacterium]
MNPRLSRQRRVIAVTCAILGLSAAANAQSALDGFDPGANDTVHAMALQADGKILVGGLFTGLGAGTGLFGHQRIGRLNPDGSVDPTFTAAANGDIKAIVVQPDGKILVGGVFTALGGGARYRIGRLNADGSLDGSFDPGADDTVNALALQPDGRILIGGQFTTLGGGGAGGTTRNRIGRVYADGSLDTGFNPGANGVVYTVAIQPGGKILVGGAFTTLSGGGTGIATRNRIGRLNADGSLDASFSPGANNNVYALAVQPDGKILAGGDFTMLGGETGTTPRNRIGRISRDGSVDGFNPNADDVVLVMSLQPDGKVLLGGAFNTVGGVTRSRAARVNPDGTTDLFAAGVNGFVSAMAVQPDGKILFGGIFTTITTTTMPATTRNRLARLNGDGTLDVTLSAGANDAVFTMIVQPDQKIVVGGLFTSLGGTPRSRIGRVRADGSPFGGSSADAPVYTLLNQPDGKIQVGGEFSVLGGITRGSLGRTNADDGLTTDPIFNPGADSFVIAMAPQADGRTVVGGDFSLLGGGGMGLNTRYQVGRLNADGTLDATFNPGANGDVYAIAVQADGKILVGGQFTTIGGGGTGNVPRQYIARLNADGSVDESFTTGVDSAVRTLAVQPDGRILVGGHFSTVTYGGGGIASRSGIARLEADGSIDASFNATANGPVYSIALQTDGKILVGGYFTALGDNAIGLNVRNRLGRFNANGSLDTLFDPGVNAFVNGLALQSDGKILVGGYFTAIGGGGTGTTARSKLARLTNTGAAFQRLDVSREGNVVTWLRGGTAPEISRVTFEVSSDGTSYTPLGVGTRVAGGWQLSGLSLPALQNVYVRARGLYSTGFTNGSISMVESIRRTYVLAPCTYALSSSSASVPSGVNFGSVTLTTNDDSCAWTAQNNGFVTVTSDSVGAGTTVVTWATAINPSASARSAVISIAGLPFTIAQAGASTTRRVPNDFNHDAISDIAVFRPGQGRWYIRDQSSTDWGAPGDLPVPGDYDGDGSPNIAVYRPSNGTWYINGGATVAWGLPGDIPVPGDYDGNGVTDIAVFRPATGQWLVRNVGTFGWGLAGDLPVQADYNGDGATDIAVYRPSTGTWYLRNIATVVWGFAADIPVPADYDGNGTADIAVFRPATGTWYIKDQYFTTWGVPGDVPVALDRSGDGVAELGVFRRATGTWLFKNHVTDTNETIGWGAAGDIPIGRGLPLVLTPPGDFDGDRRADLTVYRPSTGDWVSLRSLSGFTDYTIHTFGLSTDTPVARDYDGDGKIDPAVFRPGIGRWFLLRSSTNFADYLTVDWGLSTDIPVPGDYDGDGKADVAVFRPSTARWLVVLSSTGNTSSTAFDFGVSTDIPVPADYDGDGRTDVAVFRPSTGQWFVYNRHTSTYAVFDWGLTGDVPAPADFDGDGKADVAVFRPSLGRWFIKSSIDGSTTTADWGLSGDTLVPADFDGDGKADIAVFRP